MRLDHVSYAAGPSGLQETAANLGASIGVTPLDGGIHPRFGTRNMVLPLADDRYIEVVEVLDHPSADKAPFGQVVRARSEAGGGWMSWVVSVEDIAPVEKRLARQAVEGWRRMPDGREFRWRQLGLKGTQADPQLPFFIRWEDGSPHPSGDNASEVVVKTLQVAGDPHRVREWLGLSASKTSSVVDFDFVAPHGTPGLLSVTLSTPNGAVTI